MNLDELKTLNRSALISEITEKTKKCGLIWQQIANGQFVTTSPTYDLYLTKMSSDTYSLDVLKNASLYRSYNSNFQIEVQELYETVDSLLMNSTNIERMKALISAVGQIRACNPSAFSETLSGGLVGSGGALIQNLTILNHLLRPIALTYGPTSFPWNGDVSDIDDAPSALDHDGDASYIRQEVSGALPTQWGYAIVGFDPTGVSSTDPRTFRIRVAACREAELGVNIVIELLIGPAVIFTGTFTPSSAYTVYSSGLVAIPVGTSISSLEVRLSMYTNTGDSAPRAVRVSAVDLKINGFTDS